MLVDLPDAAYKLVFSNRCSMDITDAYARMADDEAREAEAEEWSDALLLDAAGPDPYTRRRDAASRLPSTDEKDAGKTVEAD